MELDQDSLLRIAIAALLVISAVFMKAVSLWRHPIGRAEGLVDFLLSPLPSVRTWKRSPHARAADRGLLLKKSAAAAALIIAATLFQQKTAAALSLRGAWLAYLTLPLLAAVELASAFFQWIFLGSGKLIPPVHRQVLRSTNVSDFWRRYNVWVSDWFHETIFQPLSRKPAWAWLAVFLFSGAWHELLINVPLLLLFHVNLIGTMMLYFLIQWLGAVVDKKIFWGRTFARRAFLWAVVVVPMPLVINEGVLRLLGLWRP